MSEIREGYERPADDARWVLTQRVAHSETFRRSPRLRSFLLYVVERSLLEPTDDLNEYQIGLHVFGRPESFNPAEESIVRSSARQLRAKLQEYFDGDGAHESQLLVIPKGTYVPEFVPRPLLAAQPGRPAFRRPWQVAALALAAAMLLLGWFALRRPGAFRPQPAPAGLVFAVFPPAGEEIHVVLCDSALVVVNGLRNTVMSVEEYVQRKEQVPLPLPPLQPDGATPAQFPGGRLITSFRDASFMAALAERGSPAGYRFDLRHSRLTQSRDFRSGGHILLGSPWSNPWSMLFEDRMNFRFGHDQAGRFGITNRQPLPGEQLFYFATSQQSNNGLSYARIARTPNLAGTGKVLLISGLHTESSEGASEAALSPSFLQAAERAAGGRSLAALESFELLVEVRAVDGTVQDQRLVASRFPR